MKIAVVGTGIAGMVAANELAADHDITVFEATDRVGGHTHTVPVDLERKAYAVDTGFIVYNDWTYPNFIRLLASLGVESQPTTMSFSVKCERTGLEYNGHSLNTLYAQRSNLLRPRFHRMLLEILRFSREANALLDGEASDEPLGEFLDRLGFGGLFRTHYIIPMGAAIWSTDPALMQEFPARYFLEFFRNHGLLNVKNRPRWRVIKGGSWKYVGRLIEPYRERIRLSTPVTALRRVGGKAHLSTARYGEERFDHVVLACHSDEALALLTDPSPAEQSILGSIRFQTNEAVLHTDATVLPKRRRAWAAWNYHLPRGDDQRVALTYNMNILQSLAAPREFCVTLNRGDEIDPSAVIRRIEYSHPLYDPDSVAARARHDEINGVRNTWFCGAYWTYGFHEDGVNSALKASRGIRELAAHE